MATLIIIAIVLCISSLTIHEITPEFIPNVAIIVLLFVSVVLLKKGNFGLSSALTVISVITGITWTRFHVTGQFSFDLSYDFTQYVLDLILLFFYTNLIAKSRNILSMVFVIILAFIIFYALVLPRYEFASVHPYSKSVIYSGFAFVFIAGIIGWLTFKQTKTAIENVRREENKYFSLFNSAQDAIFILKGEQFIECNNKTLQLFGCSKEDIINKTPFDFSPVHQPDGIESKQKGLQLIEKALKGVPQHFEWLHTRLDGSAFDADVSLNVVDLIENTVLLAIVRDVSENKRLQKEVYISYIMGEESERTRIAKDLHDGLGPLLSACKIYHYNLGKVTSPEEDRNSYEKLGKMLDESVVGLKEISNNLSPYTQKFWSGYSS